MIYVDTPSIERYEIEQLLAQTRAKTLGYINTQYSNPEKISGNDFEEIVYESAVNCAQGTNLDNRIVHTADRDFPDIVAADYYGIEVKATKKDGWTSIGNSVLESSRISSVQKIYLFFGKLGGTPDIRYRDYATCLNGISVTHYPRYKIDMNLPMGESIFDKMGVPYEKLRSMQNPISEIRRYYKTQMSSSDSLWWVDDDSENDPNLSPIIRNLSSLPTEEKDTIVASIMAYFPEIFSSSSKKYERIPAYLVSQYGVVTANLRDFFTAGGQVQIEYDNEHIKVPQIVSRVSQLAKKISLFLYDKNKTQLQYYWGHRIDDFADPYSTWSKEVDRQYNDVCHPHLVSDQYRKGLSDAQQRSPHLLI